MCWRRLAATRNRGSAARLARWRSKSSSNSSQFSDNVKLIMFAFFAGLAAGLLHVFSGPDHLAAVAPLAADTDRRQWRTGLQWGIGHTAGVLLIASLLLLIREQLPLEVISAYSERLVGIALILVGGWGVWKASRAGFRTHGHTHAGASFGMGALHGLAGSSHLFGVLPALAFATRLEAPLYLAG